MKEQFFTAAAVTGGCALLYYCYSKTRNYSSDINDDENNISILKTDTLAHVLSDNKENVIKVNSNIDEDIVTENNDKNILINENHIDKNINSISCDMACKQTSELSEQQAIDADTITLQLLDNTVNSVKINESMGNLESVIDAAPVNNSVVEECDTLAEIPLSIDVVTTCTSDIDNEEFLIDPEIAESCDENPDQLVIENTIVPIEIATNENDNPIDNNKKINKSKKQKKRDKNLVKDIDNEESMDVSTDNKEEKSIVEIKSSMENERSVDIIEDKTSENGSNVDYCTDEIICSKLVEIKVSEPIFNDKTVSETLDSSQNGFWSTDTENKIPSIPQAATDLIGITSDLEREATPDHDNGISDSQSLISQGSFDSGQGSIEVDTDSHQNNGNLHSMTKQHLSDQYIVYQFEISQDIVGRLIGRKGAFINKVKALTSTSAIVTDHSNQNLKICSIDGKRSSVIQALKLVRDHFPLDQFPELTLAEMSSLAPSQQQRHRVSTTTSRSVAHVELCAGEVIEVHASHVATTGEIWLQQPLHPSHAAFSRLHQCLRFNYGNGSDAPVVPLPIPAGTICVCYYNNQWLRCELLEHNREHCKVILLDIGGIVENLSVKMLRQIRVDYASLPFQARQTILHNIEPVNGSYTEEGRRALQSFVKNGNLATIAAYSLDGVPLINLYQRNNNQYTFINEKLVQLGHAKWINSHPTTDDR